MMLLSLAIAIAAAAVGCGGSGDDSSAADGASPLTKAAFIKKANAICGREREGTLAGFQTYLKQHQGSNLSEEELFADMMRVVLLPAVENDIAKLKELEPPAGNEARIEAFLVAQQKAVDGMSKVDRLSKGPSGERFFEPASQMAKAYGIDDCAQS